MNEIVAQIQSELRLLELEFEHVAGMREDVALLVKSATLRRDGEATARYQGLIEGYGRDLREIGSLLEQIQAAFARRSAEAASRTAPPAEDPEPTDPDVEGTPPGTDHDDGRANELVAPPIGG